MTRPKSQSHFIPNAASDKSHYQRMDLEEDVWSFDEEDTKAVPQARSLSLNYEEHHKNEGAKTYKYNIGQLKVSEKDAFPLALMGSLFLAKALEGLKAKKP